MTKGDEIVSLDGSKIASMDDLIDAVSKHDVGDQVEIEVGRGKNTITVKVKLGKRPGSTRLPPPPKQPAYLGLAVKSVEGKLVIGQVAKGSPAAAAGAKPGDQLISWNGKAVKTVRSYLFRVKASRPGQKVSLKLRRGEEELTITATLAKP